MTDRFSQATEGFRLTANLINLGTGCYERVEIDFHVPTVDTFAAQDLIADVLVSRLQPFLLSLRAAHRPQSSFSPARNLCSRAFITSSTARTRVWRSAAELFERAVVEDAQYSLAHSGLSDVVLF